jgi:hypothetical protein
VLTDGEGAELLTGACDCAAVAMTRRRRRADPAVRGCLALSIAAARSASRPESLSVTDR